MRDVLLLIFNLDGSVLRRTGCRKFDEILNTHARARAGKKEKNCGIEFCNFYVTL